MHPERPSARIAIAQISMHWSTAANTAAITRAMQAAHSAGARICAFCELAVTGSHRNIAAEALPHVVQPAIDQLQALCARLSLAIAVGAPTFTASGSKFNSHVLINESGRMAATIERRGLTDPEATFFERGGSRPIGDLHGVRCTAVIRQRRFLESPARFARP